MFFKIKRRTWMVFCSFSGAIAVMLMGYSMSYQMLVWSMLIVLCVYYVALSVAEYVVEKDKQ
ncbi:hypothetical protein CWE09_07480 [Aliidiomarina minuta]|uniref:Uncharacterized protein n=1 Tax=Aliidiomarina minuta TaxID=880057 RepID=A0A432W8S4_9GAMM|nr:hypothetical protein CWE09_07480 [Aliidiomarina minuta]